MTESTDSFENTSFFVADCHNNSIVNYVSLVHWMQLQSTGIEERDKKDCRQNPEEIEHECELFKRGAEVMGRLERTKPYYVIAVNTC